MTVPYLTQIRHEECIRAVLEGKKIQWLHIGTEIWNTFTTAKSAMCAIASSQWDSSKSQFRVYKEPEPDKEVFINVYDNTIGLGYDTAVLALQQKLPTSVRHYQGYIRLVRGPDDQVKTVEFVPYKKDVAATT